MQKQQQKKTVEINYLMKCLNMQSKYRNQLFNYDDNLINYVEVPTFFLSTSKKLGIFGGSL